MKRFARMTCSLSVFAATVAIAAVAHGTVTITSPTPGFSLPAPAIQVDGTCTHNGQDKVTVTWSYSGGSESITVDVMNNSYTATSTSVVAGYCQIGAQDLTDQNVATSGGTAT